MKTLKTYLLSEQMDVSHWKEHHGTQEGTNEANQHTSPEGIKHYVKFNKGQEQSRQEVASSKIHELLGVKTLKPQLITKHGRVGVASVWNDDIKQKPPKYFENLNHSQAMDIARMHHASVITKNWDTVGMEHDNIKFHKDTGHAVQVDQGASFDFRAQGAHKGFTADDIGEVHTFRDENKNYAAAHVFGHTFTKHPTVEKAALTHARNLSYNDVHAALKSTGVRDPEGMATTVMQRRDMLLKHYGE